MVESREPSPGDDYFNDLHQQPAKNNDDAGGERRGSNEEDGANGLVPKPKRIACVLCRKRKLRCDGNKPSCGTCTRLQHDCSYDEVRRKSGPKRGYVKALEARLAQVETLLKTQDEQPGTQQPQQHQHQKNAQQSAVGNGMVPEYADITIGRSNVDMMSHSAQASSQHVGPDQAQFPHTMLGANNNGDMAAEEPFPWEMIGLGLDEPLPNQDVVNELNQAYFDKVHPSMPIIHRPRYYAAMNLAPHMRPPVCLRYAMWANAATVTEKFEPLQEHFYHRARKYIQQDEMKGHGESMITVSHAQTWILLATYEFKLMYFPRAWLSAGRACRMVQMMGLHRLDGTGLDVKQCLPPPKDWTEREERRRTFWMSFCIDRFSSIGTGWPMTIEEKDIKTTLPCDEDSYELSKGGQSVRLDEALDSGSVAALSPFGGVILMACLFGRNLTHLHRPSPNDAENDLNGDFWKRHREMDSILLNIALALPDTLRMPNGINNPNIVFLNMCIHTSTICLHQAAIFKADRGRMPSRISTESKVRCITAAAETASIMRQICHLDLSAMNPFISFSLYVAARVFVQYLKSKPKDTQIRASLQFLLSAMQALKRKNPLTESFLVQLDVDLEGAGLDDPLSMRLKPSPRLPKFPVRAEGCPVSQLGVGENTTPSYNDIGVGGYTDTGGGVPLTTTAPAQDLHTFGDRNLPAFSTDNPMSFGSMTSQYELPSRHRSPGSNQGSNLHRSPQSFQPDMDTSPDGSGGAENHTPNSSTQSQPNMSGHASHIGYSPPGMQQQYQQQQQQQQPLPPQDQPTPGRLVSLFEPNDHAFATDFDMHNFATSAADAQPPGFVISSAGWEGSGMSFTPGPSGFTPGLSGMTDDVLRWSEADLQQILENMSLPQWSGSVGENGELQGMNQGRAM